MDNYIIFGRKGCPYTENALKLAKELKLKYKFINIYKITDEQIDEPFKNIIKYLKHKTVPCIFKVNYVEKYKNKNKNKNNIYKVEYIGGFDQFKLFKQKNKEKFIPILFTAKYDESLDEYKITKGLNDDSISSEEELSSFEDNSSYSEDNSSYSDESSSNESSSNESSYESSDKEE